MTAAERLSWLAGCDGSAPCIDTVDADALRAGAAALEERELFIEFASCGCPSHVDQNGVRTERPLWLKPDPDRHDDCDQLREEVERLRFKLDREEDSATRSDRARVVAEKERDQLRARVDALEGELAAWKENSDGWQKSCEDLNEDLAASRAREQRVRDALTYAVEETERSNPSDHDPDWFPEARAALAGDGREG